LQGILYQFNPPELSDVTQKRDRDKLEKQLEEAKAVGALAVQQAASTMAAPPKKRGRLSLKNVPPPKGDCAAHKLL